MGVSRIPAGSVIVKHSVNTAIYPRTILSSTAQKIDLGRVSDASLISSAALSQLFLLSNVVKDQNSYTYVQRSQSQA